MLRHTEGFINVKEYGATGDDNTDDTAAIQAAIDAAGYVNMAHSSGVAPTLVGGEGKPILFPPGVYKVTDTLYYYPGQTIYGYGMQSCISFEPITALKDLFTPKAGVGLTGDNIFRTMYFKNLLLTCNSTYGRKAIHFDDVTRWAVDDLSIQGFKYGIHNEGTSAKFFNRITSTFFRDCETGFDNEGSVCLLTECTFTSRPSGGLWEATTEYAIVNEATSLSIINCDFSGSDGMTAHIYSKGTSGLYVAGCFNNEIFPLVLFAMNRDKGSWGQTCILGNHGVGVLIKFEDLMTTPTVNFRYPHGITLGGNYRLLNLIANPSAKRFSMGWDVTNATLTYSPDPFMSRFAWRLTADGGGECALRQSVATQFERPLGARFTVTFLAKMSHSTDSMARSNVIVEIIHRAAAVIDYGNDWKLYAINVENTAESFADTQIVIRLSAAAGGTPINGHYVDISNIRIYEGEGFDIFPGDTESEMETLSDSAPTVGTWGLREKIWKITPAAGASPGWICTSSGTFSTATDNTGDTDGSTDTITGMTDTDDFYAGQYITTSAGFPNSVDASNIPVKIISKTATTLVIDDTSDTSETNITVLTPDPVFKAMASLGLAYGEISVVSNATETVITTQNVYVQITIFDTNGENNNATPDHTNDHITITKAGRYFISCSITLNSIGGSGSTAEMEIQKNNGNARVGSLHMDRTLSGGGTESGAITMTGIANLAVDDTIEVWIKNESNTQNYVVEDITLSLMQIGG